MPPPCKRLLLKTLLARNRTPAAGREVPPNMLLVVDDEAPTACSTTNAPANKLEIVMAVRTEDERTMASLRKVGRAHRPSPRNTAWDLDEVPSSELLSSQRDVGGGTHCDPHQPAAAKNATSARCELQGRVCRVSVLALEAACFYRVLVSPKV